MSMYWHQCLSMYGHVCIVPHRYRRPCLLTDAWWCWKNSNGMILSLCQLSTHYAIILDGQWRHKLVFYHCIRYCWLTQHHSVRMNCMPRVLPPNIYAYVDETFFLDRVPRYFFGFHLSWQWTNLWHNQVGSCYHNGYYWLSLFVCNTFVFILKL